MPALSPAQIVSAIENAFTDSGASSILISGEKSQPRRFQVVCGEMSFSLWVYMWTLTHGGGAARPANEYRIQLTGVASPLPLNPDGLTVLLGYEPNLKAFAGFDLTKHQTFSRKSPSIQIKIDCVHDALRNGFAFSHKGNDEIAVGLRGDNLLAYCINSESLHELGADAVISDLLNRVSRFDEVPDEDIASLSKERRRVISTVARLARDGDFRKKVTVAYDRKCAVTGLQLRLVDAAHILPVGAAGSTDDVSNGLCLSPTYHRAYDRRLIYLTEDRRMVINQAMKDELCALRLDGGLVNFESFLGREIFLPPDRNQWPNPEFIRAANSIRMIQC